MNRDDRLYWHFKARQILDRALYVMLVAVWLSGIYLVISAFMGKKP